MQFSSDGKQLSGGGLDGTVKEYRVGDGKALGSRALHETFRTMAFAQDAHTLVSIEDNKNEVRLFGDPGWRATTLTAARDTGDWPTAITRDGRSIAFIGKSGHLDLWDPVKRKPTQSFDAKPAETSALAFSWDGSLIAASGGTDVVIRDARSGAVRQSFYQPRDAASALAFSPDGTRLLAGGEGATLRLSDAKNGGLVATFIPVGREDWAVITPGGEFSASKGARAKLMVVDGMNVRPLVQVYPQLEHADMVEALVHPPKPPALLRLESTLTIAVAP